MTVAERSAQRVRLSKGAVYRLCRMLHAYLSAFAFLALIFFSATGILLNHPEWFRGTKRAGEERIATVPAAEIAAALQSATPTAALAAALARHASPRGAFKSGEVGEDEAHLRFEGVTGTSDVLLNLRDGRTELLIERASAVAILNDLHRGKNAGSAWAVVIDISGIVVLALSLIGYVLFFSLRFRLATSLKLTAASLVTLVAVFYLFVP
jgi:uncharacterized protein